MRADNINSIHQLLVGQHCISYVPVFYALASDNFNLAVIIASALFLLQGASNVLNQLHIKVLLILGESDMGQPDAVGGVHRINGGLVPNIHSRIFILSGSHPGRNAPVEHIHLQIWIDGKSIRHQLIARATSDIRRLICRAHNGRLCA